MAARLLRALGLFFPLRLLFPLGLLYLPTFAPPIMGDSSRFYFCKGRSFELLSASPPLFNRSYRIGSFELLYKALLMFL